MRELTMVSNGGEYTTVDQQSPLQLFKGPEEKIKLQALQDGALYFATDTKKIYLDCDFTDSNDNEWHDRLAFGGSSGIFFSQKEFGELVTDFNFEYREVEGVLDLLTQEKLNVPKVDDIILDEANGTFYRVTDVYDDLQLILTKKLVVAGGGGGGGEGGGGGGYTSFTARLLSRSMAFSENADEMRISYVAYAPSDLEGYETQVDIEVYDRSTNTKLFVIENIEKSPSGTEVATFDIKNVIRNQIGLGVLQINQLYSNLGFIFTDGTNRSAVQPITSFAVVSLSLTPESTNLQDFSTDATYGIVPHFDTSLVRRSKIVYTVVDQGYEVTYQEGIVENLSNNTASQIVINYQAGRPVTITSKLVGYVNEIKVESGEMTQSLMFVDPSNPIPRIVVLNWPVQENEAYTRTAIVNYRVTYGSAQVTSLSGHLLMYKKGVNDTWDLFEDTPVDFALSTNLEWVVPFEQEGYYRLKITVGSGASQQTAENLVNGSFVEYKVKGSSSDVPVVTSGAQFDFTPDRNETSSLKGVWNTTWYNPGGHQVDGNTVVIGDQEISAKFEGFNWATNGWFRVPNTNKNKLVLNNGAKFTLPLAPFYGKFNPSSGSFDGAISTGKTIEFDIKISNVRDRKKRIIDCSCYDTDTPNWEERDPEVGIIATGDYFVLTTAQLDVLSGMQTNGVVDDTVNGLVAHYSADERVHICYVIARSDADIDARYPKNYIYTYVNGVLSGIVARNSNVNFRQSTSETFRVETVFDSDYADIELYNFRFYGKALSAEAVLDNYLAGLGNVAVATERKASNNITGYYMDPDGVTTRNYSYIDLGKVIRSASIPYLVLRGGYRCDKKGTKMTQAEAGAEVSLPYFDKKDFRYVEAYFVDPNDFSRCFGIKDPVYNDAGKIIGFTSTSADRWKCTLYPQGTSSLEYPVKNLRLKVQNSNNVNQKKKYQLFPNTPPCALFTFKADYMDSSMSHNTGTANQLNDLYRSAGITLDPNAMLAGTDNEFADYQLLTAIKGRPCVIFHYNVGIKPGTEFTGADSYSNYDFIGRYNFDFDKGEPDLFGFFQDVNNKYGIVLQNNNPVAGFEAVQKDDSEVYNEEIAYYTAPVYSAPNTPDETKRWYPGAAATTQELKDKAIADYLEKYPLYTYKSVRNSIQCWEMKNNNNDLTSFRAPWNDATDRDQEYKTWIAGYESRYPEYYAEGASDKRAMSALLNWLASTNLMTATNAPLDTPIQFENNGPIYGTDSQAYRLDKFKHEFDFHMKKDFTAFYYIMTELEILMDSRAKNMMMVCYDADNETGTGHWYPIFYDMDTAMGVNNTGKLVYRYDEKDTKFGIYNTTADYPRIEGADVNSIEGIDTTKTNMEYSVLWANFRLCFAQGIDSYVAQMYREMRKGNLNLNFLLDTYNNELANAWNETFINHDSWYKYIRPKDEPNYEYDSKGNHKLIDETGSANDPSNWKLRDTNYANLLYAAQGTRSEHRKQWLKRRMLLLDGKYAAYHTAFKFNFRVNLLPRAADDPNQDYPLTLKADDTSYVWVNFKANSLGQGAPYGPIYVPEGSTVTTIIPSADLPTQEQEATTLFDQNIVNFGQLGRLGLANVKTENNTGMDNLQFKLRVFDTSLTPYQQSQHENHIANPWSTFEGAYYPLLEELNLDYMYSKMTNADLSTNTYLRTISAQHSYLKTITFPVGGVLTTIKIPNTLMSLSLKNQPLLTSVTSDDNAWTALKTLDVNGCPKLDTKTIFKIGKAKNDKINRIDLRDINWELDPTDPTECTLNGNFIVDFPILNSLITTSGLEADAPWSANTNSFIKASYYVGGKVTIKNGKDTDPVHYGLDAVAIQSKYSGCYPNLTIAYDDNADVASAFTVSYYDSAKTIVAQYTKQYAMTDIPNKTAEDLFGRLNVREFSKVPEVSHTYELVGFKIDPNDNTDLFTETVKDQTPVMTYEEALAEARSASDVYVSTSWNVITQGDVYDPTTIYYTMDSIHVIGNNDYIYHPSGSTSEEKQAAFDEYLSINDLYCYVGTEYQFRNNFTIQADNTHKEIAFYPIYVAKVRRFKVKFYDREEADAENAKVTEVQTVSYLNAAEDPHVPVSKMELLSAIDQVRVYRTVVYPDYSRVVANMDIYPIFRDATDIREVPTAEAYFDTEPVNIQEDGTHQNITGIIAIIKKGYDKEAICIPKTINGVSVVGVGCAQRSVAAIQEDLEGRNLSEETIAALEAELAEAQAATHIKRVFFEANNNIQYIKHGAFTGSTALEFVDFVACENLLMIGNYGQGVDYKKGPFRKCINLHVTNLPNGITVFGYGCFAEDPEFKITEMPVETRLIGHSAFRNDTGLGTVTVGLTQQWVQVGQYAFAGCSNFQFSSTDLTNFAALTRVEDNAFNGCSKISFFTDTSAQQTSMTVIGRQAFADCSVLGWNKLPTSLTEIGGSAFARAGNIGFTTFQPVLKKIGSQAFYDVTFNGNGGLVMISINDLNGMNYAADVFQHAKLSQFIFVLINSAQGTPMTEESFRQSAFFANYPWGATTMNGSTDVPYTIQVQ